MKQLLTVAVIGIILLCTQPVKAQQDGREKKKMRKEAMTASMVTSGNHAAFMMPEGSMAYTPTYSSQFAFGSQALAKRVMDLYKDYETNKFAISDAFADSVAIVMPDGLMVMGPKEVGTTFQKGRNTAPADLKFNIHAVIPLRSTDKDEDWVVVWGDAGAEPGKSETMTGFNHIWRFDKAGKVAYMRIFEGKMTMPK